MKKVIFATVAFCLIDTVLATTYRIVVRKDDNLDMVKVSYNWKPEKSLKAGKSIDFGEIGTGFWNGVNFFMSAGNLSADDLKISSKEIPVVFDSFLSSQCEVYAPLVGILGDTQIDNLSVISNKSIKSLADIEGNNEALLIVQGNLTTKFLNAYGSTEIELDGTVNLQKNGVLCLLGYGSNDYLGILGTLSSKGRLNVETADNPSAKVINSGNIKSDTNEISIKTNRFINNETGMILGKKASFQVNTLIENYGFVDFEEFDLKLPDKADDSIENYGLIDFEEFSGIFSKMSRSIAEWGYSPLQFKQYGTFIVRNQASLDCNLENFGRTYIVHLVFPYVSELKMARGETLIDKISGRTSFVGAKEGAIAKIGNLEDGADHVESHGDGSELVIKKLVSDKKVVFAPKSGGEIIIGSAQAPESFMYTEDGEINLGKLEGKSLASAKGTGKLKVSGATDFTLVAEEEAETLVDKSVVKEAYLLGNKKNTFMETTVESLCNQGNLRAINTNIKSAENDNEMNLVGNTLTNKLSNSGVVTFENGKHHVESYVGRSVNAAIKAKSTNQITEEKSADTIINAEKRDQISDKTKKLLDFEKRVILQTGSSLVTIDNIAGTGDIEAFRQIYNKKLPSMFHTIGNVAAVLDYMPRPNEIPEHDDGDFLILANMYEDYINSTNINYGDVLVFMQMNGHKWENKYSKFIAGGLKVNNATSWENTEGFIGLERLLSVDAKMIYNISTPIARDNGRWVDDRSNWRARLVYYCPATYYSPKSNTGITVIDGDINLKSQTNILNQFSNIYASGNFNAKAENIFDNKVGNILVLGKGQSSIEAQNIRNECLPLYVRKGEAHAKGRCGWGWNRHTWYADSYTAELVTQSPGSKIFVEGNFKIVGKVENIGSELLSGKLFSGDVNSRSVLENTAIHGSKGSVIEGNILKSDASLFFIYRDKLGGHKNNSEGKQVFDMKNK